MRKYDHAHKYGWFDYLYDLTDSQVDWFMVLTAIALVALISLLHNLGLI